MSETYAVTKRGLRGEPLEIQCLAHSGCSWRMQSTGMKPDNDAVFMAQFNNHLENAKVPDLKAFGHLRRSRR